MKEDSCFYYQFSFVRWQDEKHIFAHTVIVYSVMYAMTVYMVFLCLTICIGIQLNVLLVFCKMYIVWLCCTSELKLKALNEALASTTVAYQGDTTR